jgi:mRNA-degrading endonuclease RelE of RelBE toxin-antitoxin system
MESKDLAALNKSREEFDRDEVTWFSHSIELCDHLKKLWNPEFHPPRYSLSMTRDWTLGFGSKFRKSIEKIDKNLGGRILEAISELSEAPMTPRGDTIKPLEGNLRGLWRYRIGDRRIVYEPVPDRRRVRLLLFDTRDAVYS